MPSHPIDTGWDFGPVLNLIDSDLHDIGSPTLSSTHRTYLDLSQNSEDAKRNRLVRLGSFSNIWEGLGVPGVSTPSALSPVDLVAEDFSSDDALLPASTKIGNDDKVAHSDTSNTASVCDFDGHHAPSAIARVGNDIVANPMVETAAKTSNRSDEDPTTGSTAVCDKINGDKPEHNSIVLGTTSHLESEDEVTVDPYAGMTKKERHQARQRAMKQQKAQRKLEKKEKNREEWRKKFGKGSKAVAELAIKTPVTKGTAPDLSPDKIPTRARSNVGAIIKPPSPVQQTGSGDSGEETVALDTRKGPTMVPEAPLPNIPSSLPMVSSSTFTQSTVIGLVPQTPRAPSITEKVHPSANPPPVSQLQYPALDTPVVYFQQYPLGFSPYAPANGVVHPQAMHPSMHGLVPRTVQPTIIQRRSQPEAARPSAKTPVTPSRPPNTITIRPQVDRHLHFFTQLIQTFPEDRRWLAAPMQLCNDSAAVEGIHVFVDASNILIGYKDKLRMTRTHRFPMSFDSLALLMERRRPVAKRVYAGSQREADPLPEVTKVVETSRLVGYENNIKEQVFIRREDTEKRKFFNEVKRVGWQAAQQRRAGSGSDSEMGPAAAAVTTPATPSAPKWVEQGVDEILHLKMCQSIIDTEVPTTIVLATGDGAEAEHSDGFLAHVERALKKGWKVELVSWKYTTNAGYRNKKFRARWGEQFKSIELDDYVEALVDTP
ncbi:hypothetical protein BDV95DRAFT_663145 [Massariosphaeria phaeospora]|uniref:NYN domain-containing protein n=1 Tax=Massariosphaeria phaeospora TaxID=100035 RepID=A0A7C8IET6_9PLEO|nr:hypothetical protein BDV95DRAFT_663145 [Massariosphaeria phaeospora]